MLTVERRERIRRAYYIEGKHMRQIGAELRHSYWTIRAALDSAAVRSYQLTVAKPAPVLGEYKGQIEALLPESERQPRKQRYTSHKIYQLLQLAETKQELRKVNAELSQQLNSQFNKLGGYIGGPAIVPGPFVSADSILARIAGNVTLAYGPRVENEGVGTLMLGEDYTLENGLLTKKFDSK